MRSGDMCFATTLKSKLIDNFVKIALSAGITIETSQFVPTY